jgi:hypothetical protein
MWLASIRSTIEPAIMPGLAILSGSIGAYAFLWNEIFIDWSAKLLSGAKTAHHSGPPPVILSLLVGSIVGFYCGVILPSAILRSNGSINSFNPSALCLIASIAGYIGVRATSAFLQEITAAVSSSIVEVDKDSVTSAVREALLPPQLVNFRGYLNFCFDDIPAVDGRFKIPTSLQYLRAKIQVTSNSRTEGLSLPIIISNGSEGDNVTFQIEINGNELKAPAVVEVVANTDRGSTTHDVTLCLSSDALQETQIELHLTVSQFGRLIALLPIYLDKDALQ